MELKATWEPGRPYADVVADVLAALGSDRLSFVGRHVRYGEAEFIVDSVSDIGDGRWRLRLIPPSTD